jgi:hypothetical protein
MSDADSEKLQQLQELLRKIEDGIRECKAILRGEKHD